MSARDLSHLPPPPVPLDMDLRDVPFPREFFAELAHQTWGVPVEKARAFIDQFCDKEDAERQAGMRLDRRS